MTSHPHTLKAYENLDKMAVAKVDSPQELLLNADEYYKSYGGAPTEELERGPISSEDHYPIPND